MSVMDGISILGCFILSAGMFSVLFHGFRIQDKPKRWKSEMQNRYVPELLRKKLDEPAKDKTEEKEGSKDPWWIRMWYK